MDAVSAGKIINQVAQGWRVVAVAVPTRALRVVCDDLALKFRIEQLNLPAHLGDLSGYTWSPVSTHQGDEAWESWPHAHQDLITKQTRLKEKIKLAQHEQRMAMVKAQNAASS